MLTQKQEASRAYAVEKVRFAGVGAPVPMRDGSDPLAREDSGCVDGDFGNNPTMLYVGLAMIERETCGY
jgi:hypothetical protein